MTIIVSRVINLFSIFVFDTGFHVFIFWVNFRDVGNVTLTLIPDWKFRQSVMNIEDERWKVGVATVKQRITTHDLISLSSNSG